MKRTVSVLRDLNDRARSVCMSGWMTFLFLLQFVRIGTRTREIFLVSQGLSSGARRGFRDLAWTKLGKRVSHHLGQEFAGASSRLDEPTHSVHILTDVRLIALRRFNSVFQAGRCLISPRSEPSPWDFGISQNGDLPSVRRQHGRLIDIRAPRQRDFLSCGIYIGARAPTNYYHWLINALPSLYVMNQSANIPRDFPVIVPSEVSKLSTLWAPLEMLAEKREIHLWPRDVELAVQRCAVIESPPVYDTPLSRDRSRRLPLTIDRETMAGFREYLIRNFPQEPHDDGYPEKIYLARRGDDIRTPNGAELMNIAIDYGFEIVYCEEESFATQMRIFESAKFVIGPGGAAFTNVLFCSPGARLMMWKPEPVQSENMFENLALISGADFQTTYLGGFGSVDSLSSQWVFPTKEFRLSLEKFKE
jgi:hypothetical protein